MNFTPIVELIGFIARTVSAKNVDDRGPYIVQFILIIVAPVLMAAGFYVVFVSPTQIPAATERGGRPDLKQNWLHKGRIILRVLSKEHATARIIWVPRKLPQESQGVTLASGAYSIFVQLAFSPQSLSPLTLVCYPMIPSPYNKRSILIKVTCSCLLRAMYRRWHRGVHRAHWSWLPIKAEQGQGHCLGRLGHPNCLLWLLHCYCG